MDNVPLFPKKIIEKGLSFKQTDSSIFMNALIKDASLEHEQLNDKLRMSKICKEIGTNIQTEWTCSS